MKRVTCVREYSLTYPPPSSPLLPSYPLSLLKMEHSGIIVMLANDKMDDLHRMYKLFGRVKPAGHAAMKTKISEYIKLLGREINESVGGCGNGGGSSGGRSANATQQQQQLQQPLLRSSSSSSITDQIVSSSNPNNNPNNSSNPSSVIPIANPIKWVEAILQLKDKFDVILNTALLKDKSFQTEMNSALQTVMNLNVKCPEFISLFLDENLKKGLKGVKVSDGFIQYIN